MSLDLTGLWTSLPESALSDLATDGSFQHFRDRASTEHDPFTGSDTGQTARQILAAQAATFGWPLIGIYLSGSGGLVPHLTIHRSQFPPQTGSPSQRADKLTAELDAAFDRIYKSSITITDPADPDFGQTIELRKFWLASHVWAYRSDGLYVPRSGGLIGPHTGDYGVYASNSQPPGNWWQNR